MTPEDGQIWTYVGPAERGGCLTRGTQYEFTSVHETQGQYSMRLNPANYEFAGTTTRFAFRPERWQLVEPDEAPKCEELEAGQWWAPKDGRGINVGLLRHSNGIVTLIDWQQRTLGGDFVNYFLTHRADYYQIEDPRYQQGAQWRTTCGFVGEVLKYDPTYIIPWTMRVLGGRGEEFFANLEENWTCIAPAPISTPVAPPPAPVLPEQPPADVPSGPGWFDPETEKIRRRIQNGDTSVGWGVKHAEDLAGFDKDKDGRWSYTPGS